MTQESETSEQDARVGNLTETGMPQDAVAVDELRAVDGRVPGRRGRQTRQNLLDCTMNLLEERSFRELKVVDIAREAGTSPATFYQYFPGVEEAILALAEEMSLVGSETIVALPGEELWSSAGGFARAQRIATAFVDFWADNQAVMRVIDLTAEEGDTRFRAIRTRLLREFNNELAAVIELEQTQGDQPRSVHAMATAGVLVSMLSNVASHSYIYEEYGIDLEALKDSMARVVYSGVTGKAAP